jgi:hypothetical protein
MVGLPAAEKTQRDHAGSPSLKLQRQKQLHIAIVEGDMDNARRDSLASSDCLHPSMTPLKGLENIASRRLLRRAPDRFGLLG